MMFDKAPSSHGCGRLNQRLKFYRTIEAGGTWIFSQPLSDLWTVIRLFSAIYLIAVTALSMWYTSMQSQYNTYWMGIYSWWVLLINTTACALSAGTTTCIWYRYKFPQTLFQRQRSFLHHHTVSSLAQWDFESVSDAADRNDEERLKQIDLHSDTDVTDTQSHSGSQCTEHLNAMSLNDLLYGLRWIHSVSKFLSNLGLSAQITVAVCYWIMADQRLENANDDTDWMVTILNLNAFILTPALLLFLYTASFRQLDYVGTVWVLLFDGIFSLCILIVNARNTVTNQGNVPSIDESTFNDIDHLNDINDLNDLHDLNEWTIHSVTVLGRRSVFDNVSFDLLALFLCFMSGHVVCQWLLTLSKNVVLLQYMKWLRQ